MMEEIDYMRLIAHLKSKSPSLVIVQNHFLVIVQNHF